MTPTHAPLPQFLTRRTVLEAILMSAAFLVFPQACASTDAAESEVMPGSWRTWLLTSSDELRPAIPPPPTPDELSELLELQGQRTARMLAVASGVAMALALRTRGGIAAQEEPMTASGGGVNLKLMPDVEGEPRVPLRESFIFDAYYAQCIIEDNPEPFSMETYTMEKIVIERHSFFMAMYANEVSLVSIRDLGDGRRVAKLTGDLGCLTEAGTATRRVGSRETAEPAFFEIEAIDGGHGGGAAATPSSSPSTSIRSRHRSTTPVLVPIRPSPAR